MRTKIIITMMINGIPTTRNITLLTLAKTIIDMYSNMPVIPISNSVVVLISILYRFLYRSRPFYLL
jgi:hypothetical protein